MTSSRHWTLDEQRPLTAAAEFSLYTGSHTPIVKAYGELLGRTLLGPVCRRSLRHEQAQILRSSHSLLVDAEQIEDVAATVERDRVFAGIELTVERDQIRRRAVPHAAEG